MRLPRPVLIATVLTAATGSLLLAPPSATADREPPVREGTDQPTGAAGAPANAARNALTSPVTDLSDSGLAAARRGYPREQVLSPDPENPADKSIKLGLTPYHAIAPKLNALQRLGDRVSVEVAGRSAGGHRLYLVTVTAPESARESLDQERMRELIENAPQAAAKDPAVKASYKTPVFFDNNIHGNEWEGTDAALQLIERLASAKDAQTTDLLAHSRLYFNITANPDGRIAGTRANANGFDLNRDFITASQPEARAIRQIAIDKQPAVMLDLHGYVNGTLIEPTTRRTARTTSTTSSSRTPTPTPSAWRPPSTASVTPPRRTVSSPSRSPSATSGRAGTTGRRSSRPSTRRSTARSPRTPWRSRWR